MKPVLIYFRESAFKENKFVLDFSDSYQHVRSIEFEKNVPYYVATLNCKLQLKKIVHAHNKESQDAVVKLAKKSEILLDKGSDRFCDIDHINLVYSPIFKNFDIVHLRNNFYFEREPKNLAAYSYKYKFWDEKEKNIKDAEIYSPYSQLICKGLMFKQKVTNIQFLTKLDKEMEQLHSFFYSLNVRDLTYQIGLEYFRDINLYFVFDENVPPRRTSAQKWYTTNVNFFNEAICEKATNHRFNEADFAKKYYNDDRKGDRVIGTYAQRLRPGSKKYLMPITWVFGSLRIIPNEPFFTSDTIEFKSSSFLKDANIKDLGQYALTDKDKAEIQKSIPNFRLHKLRKYVCETNGTNRWQNEIMFYPKT